ncbi:hypothetical protein AB0J82_21865 [Asanoa sp. NPDC049518]|uniref:hypothetical protein n=1 Tax=unclassified Asanoa TaxID=2685164 RepID=UPI00342E4876
MRSPHLPRLAALAVFALASVAAAAACTSAPGPSKAVPGPAGSTTASTAPATAGPTPAVRTPQAAAPVAVPRHTRSSSGSRCLGAVVHRLNAADTGPPWRPLCMGVGGILRVENLGPDGFTVSPSDKMDCWYEAGVRECRLVHPGKVRLTIDPGDAGIRTLSLTIASASKPAPACRATAPYGIDAAEGGPPWPALCLKVGAVLRVSNLGPEGFVVSPADAVRCSYEAAVRDCRFLRPGTVTFAITHGDSATRTLTVVVVR